MAEFTKYTSGFNVGGENIGIEAAKVGWGAVSALTAVSTSTATSGIMTPDQIQKVVADRETTWEDLAGLTAASGSISTSGIMTPDQIQAAIAAKCGELTSFEIATSTKEMTKSNVIYLLKKGDAKTDNYEEYVVIGGTPTLIGETSIDLTPYATVTAMTAADQEIKDSLTAYQTVDGMSAYPTKDEISGTDGILKNYATTADLDTVSGKLDTVSGNLDTVSGNLDTVSGNLNTVSGKLDTVSGNLDTVSGDVDALKTASGDYVTSAFGKVVVTNGTTTQTYSAAAKDDTIKFIAGDNITLDVGADTDGNPTITIKGDVQETILPEIAGFNGVSAEAVKNADNKTTGYNVSGVDATTANAGVVKADYYDATDGLIHLF